MFVTKRIKVRENFDVFSLGFKKCIYLGFGKGDKKKKKIREKEERRDFDHTTHSFQNA